MRKSNWLIIAVAVVASFLLLWAWFALGFNHVDDPVDMVVAVIWWVAVAAVIAAIVWAENKRRQKMQTAFLGKRLVYSPEFGVFRTKKKQSEIDMLQDILAGMTFPDRVVPLDNEVRDSFRWVVRTRNFKDHGKVWEGEVLPANDPKAQARVFASKEDLAALLAD